MPSYISEFQYYGDSSEEFIEVALPMGTDASGYTVVLYDNNGNVYNSFSLGTATATMTGHDVYVIDDTTPGFSTADSSGNFYPDDALALVDGDGNVVQFLSYWDNTVTAVDGPASGLTSTDVGTADPGQSLQSDDGGSSYYTQSSTNSGSIPACYGPGTLIKTPTGSVRVEGLKPGDQVCGIDRAIHIVRWVWSGLEPLDNVQLHQKPVKIGQNAFAPGVPDSDLVVSGQHRMAVGVNGQLQSAFPSASFVPAKSLVKLPKIRFCAGKSSMMWYHFLCDDHCVVFANGTASETLFLGDEIVINLNLRQRRAIDVATDKRLSSVEKMPLALPCYTVGQARDRILADRSQQVRAMA